MCFLRDTSGQELNKGHKTGQKNNGDIAVHLGSHDTHDIKHVSEHKGQEQNVAGVQEIKQHVGQHIKSTDNSKVSIEIPSQVQKVVAQVSQHIPLVVSQHVAKQKQRVQQPGKCEFFCSSPDVAVCGYNGRCYLEFESQCNLSNYNCLNTAKSKSNN